MDNTYNRQYTLYSVTLDVSEAADLEVAHRHPRKPRRRRPVVAGGERAQDVDAVQVKVVAHEDVQEEQLREDVGKEQELDEEVQRNEVVAASATAADAQRSGEAVLQAHRTAGRDVALVREVSGQSNAFV